MKSPKYIIDFPKVCQMLDAGWELHIYKNEMGSYSARAKCHRRETYQRARDKYVAAVLEVNPSCPMDLITVDWEDDVLVVETDHFTPEELLTAIAYKVQGEFQPESEDEHE